MGNKYNIVGDLAGRYDELMLLLKKVPKGELVSVGDIVDRGKKSAQLLQYFIDNKVKAVLGNHEHMMLDALLDTGFYGSGIWAEYNGGLDTIESYYTVHGKELPEYYDHLELLEDFKSLVPTEHIEYLKALPLYLELNCEGKKYVVTHAPINPVVGLKKASTELLITDEKGNYNRATLNYTPTTEFSTIWNRGNPRRIPEYYLQVHGHNARKNVQYESDRQGKYSVNIDTSYDRRINILHLPDLSTYEQEYLP